MALHLIKVSIIPETPMIVPLRKRILLETINPDAAAAKPEYEISKDVTTGILAPPIGTTISTPSAEETTKTYEIYSTGLTQRNYNTKYDAESE
jgi:hypothetical protein